MASDAARVCGGQERGIFEFVTVVRCLSINLWLIPLLEGFVDEELVTLHAEMSINSHTVYT